MRNRKWSPLIDSESGEEPSGACCRNDSYYPTQSTSPFIAVHETVVSRCPTNSKATRLLEHLPLPPSYLNDTSLEKHSEPANTVIQ